MPELENLLKDALPKMKKPEEKKILSDKDVHSLVTGKYLSENEKIFCVDYFEKLPFNFDSVEIQEFKIPQIVEKWAGIQNIKLDDLLFIDTEKLNDFHHLFILSKSRLDIPLKLKKQIFSGRHITMCL